MIQSHKDIVKEAHHNHCLETGVWNDEKHIDIKDKVGRYTSLENIMEFNINLDSYIFRPKKVHKTAAIFNPINDEPYFHCIFDVKKRKVIKYKV